VAVSADGKWAVSASADRTLKVWDVEHGVERHTLAGHKAPVRSVAVSADGKWAVSASDDGTLRVWDLPNGTLLQTLESYGGYVVAVAPDGKIVSVSREGTRRVWELAHPVSESEFDFEPALNKVVERSADGKRYIVGVRNAELQRLQELKDEGKSGFLPDLGELRSR
jgi:WD40 repeat protein